MYSVFPTLFINTPPRILSIFIYPPVSEDASVTDSAISGWRPIRSAWPYPGSSPGIPAILPTNNSPAH